MDKTLIIKFVMTCVKVPDRCQRSDLWDLCVNMYGSLAKRGVRLMIISDVGIEVQCLMSSCELSVAIFLKDRTSPRAFDVAENHLGGFLRVSDKVFKRIRVEFFVDSTLPGLNLFREER